VIGSPSYPPSMAPAIITVSANPTAAMGDRRSFGNLPKVVSRHPVVAPSGVGTSQATHVMTATRVMSVPHSGPNENGSRLAIQRAMATVAATAATKVGCFFVLLSPLMVTGWSLL